MNTRNIKHHHLATARALLLDPYGLSERELDATLATIARHRVDDADLFFQYTRTEGWSLEEGIVKTGSFSIDQGVGVRAVTGERTAFAYSDDLSPGSLQDAACTVRAISAAAGVGRVYWQTHETNHTAMQLYDKVAERSGFIVYRKSL